MKALVTTTVYATVTILNPEVTERVTGPAGDEWRSQFYPSIETAEDVCEHFVYNAIKNGVHDIRKLDGWADCDERDALIEIDEFDQYTEVLP